MDEKERELILVEADFIHNLKDLCLLLSERKLHEAIKEKERLHEECSREHSKDRTYKIKGGVDESEEQSPDYIRENQHNFVINDDMVDVKLEIDHELDTLDNWNIEPDSDISEDSANSYRISDDILMAYEDKPMLQNYVALSDGKIDAIQKGILQLDKGDGKSSATSKSTICVLCEASFSFLDELEVHYNQIHPEGQTFECPKCTFTTLARAEVIMHVHTKHGTKSKKKFSKKCIFCPYCSQYFKNAENLNKHIKIVHEEVELNINNIKNCKMERKKQFQCSICSHEMSSKTRIREHMNAVHTKSKNFICEKCDFTSNYSRNLVKHMWGVHGEGKGNIYTCDQCGYTTKRQYLYKNHLMNLHNVGDHKPGLCTICGMTFKTRYYLMDHMYKVHKKTLAGKDTKAAKKEKTLKGFDPNAWDSVSVKPPPVTQ